MSRLRLLSTAARVRTDADCGDAQPGGVALDTYGGDEVLVEVEVAMLAREQSLDGGPLFGRRDEQSPRHLRGEMLEGATDVPEDDGIPDGRRKLQHRPQLLQSVVGREPLQRRLGEVQERVLHPPRS